MPKENATFCKKKPLERGSFFNQDDMLNIQPQKNLEWHLVFLPKAKDVKKERNHAEDLYRLLSNE